MAPFPQPAVRVERKVIGLKMPICWSIRRRPLYRQPKVYVETLRLCKKGCPRAMKICRLVGFVILIRKKFSKFLRCVMTLRNESSKFRESITPMYSQQTKPVSPDILFCILRSLISATYQFLKSLGGKIGEFDDTIPCRNHCFTVEIANFTSQKISVSAILAL